MDILLLGFLLGSLVGYLIGHWLGFDEGFKSGWERCEGFAAKEMKRLESFLKE